MTRRVTGYRRHRGRLRRRGGATAGMTLLTAAALLAAGCASFPDAVASFGQQPSLVPRVATVLPPGDGAGPGVPAPPVSTAPDERTGGTMPPARSGAPDPTSPSASRPGSTPATGSTRPSAPPDACAPPALPVVAVCLQAPWGLAPLPDGQSALVGERATGQIFRVAPEREPEPVATVRDVDADGSGGLLGIALSPYYVEDGLIYAYVTTARDSRVIRISPGDGAKAIVTGLPRGGDRPGGPIAFGDDGLLYVATGAAARSGSEPTGNDGSTRRATDLAGAVLRVDTFGHPAPDNSSRTAVFASGLVDPTGICPLPGGRMGVLDHRASGDLLIRIQDGGDYSQAGTGDVLWTYPPGTGGGADCAVAHSALFTTSREDERVTRIGMARDGGFTGSPQELLAGQYGRLRTAVTGPGGLVWLTTANTAGSRRADPSDDRVLILPPQAATGGQGGID